MKYDPIDQERLVRLLSRGQERGRSLEAPRALPPQNIVVRPAVTMLRLTPPDGSVDSAILRISEHSERVMKALAEETERMDAARNTPKRFTREVKVENPYGREFVDEQGFSHNRPDRVEKIVDTIDHMLKARQIDRGQEAAARKVQDAWATAHGSMRCVLAAAEGSGGGTGSLTDAQIRAGEILNDVRKALGELDAPIVTRVCGMGMSIEETACIVFGIPDGTKVGEREAKHVGMRLRMGLAHLAKRWGISGKGGAKVVGVRAGIAGRDNQKNLPVMSEAERERTMPLRFAAEERDRRLMGKMKRKKKKENTGDAR